MAEGVVKTGLTANLAALLQSKLNRQVVIHRTEQTFKKPGERKLSSSIRYSMYIEGSNPEMFFGMTITEVKSRLAMLIDLIYSGVILPGPKKVIIRDFVEPTVTSSIKDDTY